MTQVPPRCAAADARPADAVPDAPPTCASNASCVASAPICDTATSTCRGCVADTECGDDVCIEHVGQCVNGLNTLYLAPNGANTGTCTKAAPCVSLAYAQMLVAPNRRVVAIADGTYASAFTVQTSINANSLTISGPDRDPAGVEMAGGVIIENSTKDIVIEGVTIRNSTGRALENRGTLTLSRVLIDGSNVGVLSSNAGTLRIWDSAITGNSGLGIDLQQTTLELARCLVTQNVLGGVQINNASTTIESTVISVNGGSLSQVGGVRYLSLNGKPQVFRFNTVTDNVSANTAGVQCPTPITLDSSIFTDGITTECAPEYSLFAAGPPTGVGNVVGNPAFVSTGDFHIGPTSPARDAANPLSAVARDVDGEIRPQGPGRDIGADEVP
jgi:hypothetical protein